MPTNNSSDELKQSVAAKRRAQQAFIARGLASLEGAKKSGEYVSSEEVLRELNEMLASAKIEAQKKAV